MSYFFMNVNLSITFRLEVIIHIWIVYNLITRLFPFLLLLQKRSRNSWYIFKAVVCRLIAHDNSGENRKETTIYGTISWHECQRMLHSPHFTASPNFECLFCFFWFDKIACALNSSRYHFNHITCVACFL